MDNENIPNCDICQFCHKQYTFFIGVSCGLCGAQAFKNCKEVYQNDLCKKLYKPIEKTF